MSSSSPSINPPNPTTPSYTDNTEWITAYLAIHTMSNPSRRYGYLLWIAVVFVFLVFALLHWTGSRGGFIGAKWSKWSLRRRTWRKKHSLVVARKRGEPHRQPSSLPSNAQLLCLCLLFLATAALSVAGPDYIAPGLKLWKFSRRSTDPNPGVAYNDSSFQQPQYTIWKAWWTSAGRTGLIAFALLPLCVLFALKAPPFAIFALPFMIQLHFDKLSSLHRWSGRLIWLMSALHVALWTVQLVTEHRQSTGKMALKYAWIEVRFVCGWIAFGLLTLVIALSIKPLRRVHYEAFYFLHVLLVPMFLVSSAFHHPQVWWWCWAALSLWIGERCWRATWWLHSNGYFGGMTVLAQVNQASTAAQGKVEAWELKDVNVHRELLNSSVYPLAPSRQSTSSRATHHKSPLNPTEGQQDQSSSNFSPGHSPMNSFRHTPASSASLSQTAVLAPNLYLPPPGYAHAELLAGRTVRLRFVSPGFVSWAPGQHFLINIPSISHFTSHPFTVASVCDETGPDAGRTIVLLIRAKNGWTRDLWDTVTKLTLQRKPHPAGERPTRGAEMPHRGVLMRMYVDGPFGSAVRARWGAHASVLIIAGGSGVSFGLGVLEHVCMCLSGRDGRDLGGRPGGWGKKGFLTSRVRFIWLVREFCHIQWGATALRRCLAMVPAPGLQIDIFVTNFKPSPAKRYTIGPAAKALVDPGADELAPPAPGFVREAKNHSRNDSVESLDGADDEVDLSYYTSEHSDWENPLPISAAQEEAGEFEHGLSNEDWHILDLTNFDGDDDVGLPGEEALNHTVKKQGKLRRAKTRKATRATPAAMERLRERRSTRSAQGHDDLQNHNPPARDHVPRSSHDSTGSTDRLVSYNSPLATYGLEQRLSPTMEVDLGSPSAEYDESVLHIHPRLVRSPSPVYPESSIHHDHSETGHFNNWDSRSDAASTRQMISRTGIRSAEEMRLDIDEGEMHDVDVVSEHARPGKPKLDRIVADEVEGSQGSMIVGCCGPTSLNAMVRKIVAAKIDPARIRRGDMRGMIALVSEEFEY